jgi:hypothetical protein
MLDEVLRQNKRSSCVADTLDETYEYSDGSTHTVFREIQESFYSFIGVGSDNLFMYIWSRTECSYKVQFRIEACSRNVWETSAVNDT